MNILILARESHVGGLMNYTYNLAQGLSKKDDTNVIIGISPSDANKSLMSFNLHEIDFETKSPIKLIKNYRIIARIVKEYKIDIIQAHNRITAIFAWLYCYFHKNVKYLWVNLVLPIPSSFFYRKTTKYGDCAITGPDGVKALVNDLRIPKEKVKVINLGVELCKFTKTTSEEQDELRKKIGVKDNEKLILLYGRLDKIKGHEFLLDSLRLVNNINYKIVFPGENQEYKNHLLELIKKSNLEEKIIFPGYINGREYLSITDLMVLPSVKDGISYAFLESITMGVPVVRTKTGDYYEDVKDLCYWVDYGDTEGLAQLIEDFLIGDKKFSKTAELAKKESYRFSVEKMVEDYYDLYCSILDKK